MSHKILLTGGTGFVGSALREYCKEKIQLVPVSLRTVAPEDIDFTDCGSIFHLAGKAHQMTPIDDEIYFQVNHELTINLAKAAKKAGVNHFIFISTIKVFGENLTRKIFNETTECLPDDAYGESKRKAEIALQEMEDATFKVAIIRPPLVYGPGVKGNLINLLNLIDKNLPLPFGGINNKRSMVYLGNLIALMLHVQKNKSSGIFLAGDQEPISTSYLISTLQEGVGGKKNLIKLPGIFRKIIKFLKPQLYYRLFDSLIIENKQTNKVLNFHPPYTTAYGLVEMAKWYKQYNNE